MKKNPKLESIRKRIPAEVKLMIDHSFAVVDRIDEIIVKKDISQRQLAEMLGKKESEISRWMRGTHNFTIKTIAKLETILGEPIFQIASREPVVCIMNIKSGSTKTSLVVRGERTAGAGSGKLYTTSSMAATQIEEPIEQFN